MKASMMVNAFDARQGGALDAETRALIARREQVLAPMYGLFYQHPAQFVRSEGVWLYDAHGEAYLDAYNNVPVVGHCHPRVVAAVSRQMALLNTHTRYLDEGVVRYAEDLLATLPVPDARVVFNCSGSESNDLALRLCRYVTGGEGIVVTENAYHGVTTEVARITPSFGARSPLGVAVRTVAPPIAAAGETAEQVGARFAAGVDVALADLRRHGIRPAALIVDTVFSSDGVRPHPAGFLKQAVDAVHAAGALVIADEVQAGFGRLGAAMWGFERHGVAPDVVTMGKPMGNGLPISAVVAPRALFERFADSTRYFNTFGGNPVCCAAAQAVLDVIREEHLRQNVVDVGGALIAALRELAGRHACLAAVRGEGLFIGVDVVDPETGKPSAAFASRIVNALREARVLISASGRDGDVLKIRPPLVFSRANATQLVETLDRVLTHLHG